ncbi:MAG: branched-chain amino acid ABC transporter permease [Rhodospirillaceae bacterium]|nr:branched-chain amino acid ABC transporter permease [Rhodospirillaceae bacterium]MBT6119179.1 branched-chain amino acid ABC transporter permease [Rhodospirillaceae bacterium]
MDPAAELAQHLIAGSGAGCIYGLLGLGFGLIYRASRVINFAHGEVMALGAFCALAGTEAGFGPVGGLALALPAAALASLAVGRLTAKVAGDGAPLAGIAVTAACAVLLRFAIETMPGWGTETHALESDFLAGTLAWGAVPIARADLAALAVTALILAGLALAGRVTRLGLALRAHIDDPRAAALTGVDPARMRDLAWLLAGALAAVAGLLVAPLAFVHSGMGILAINGFAAAALFGLARPVGALAGGLLIGIGETLLAAYMPGGTAELAVYATLLGALALRGAQSARRLA